MKNYHLGDVAGDAVEDVDKDEEDCDQDRHSAWHTFRWHQKAETRFEKRCFWVGQKPENNRYRTKQNKKQATYWIAFEASKKVLKDYLALGLQDQQEVKK